jgi:hypothetical protein
MRHRGQTAQMKSEIVFQATNLPLSLTFTPARRHPVALAGNKSRSHQFRWVLGGTVPERNPPPGFGIMSVVELEPDCESNGACLVSIFCEPDFPREPRCVFAPNLDIVDGVFFFRWRRRCPSQIHNENGRASNGT